jgi:hypothetical protein
MNILMSQKYGCRPHFTSLESSAPIPVAPCGLGCGSAAAYLLGLWVRIPLGIWMSVDCECCVLSSRGLCEGPIPRLEESYRVCVCVMESYQV